MIGSEQMSDDTMDTDPGSAEHSLPVAAVEVHELVANAIASLSHDLRGRLISIDGFAQCIAAEPGSSEMQGHVERLTFNAGAAQRELSAGVAYLRLAMAPIVPGRVEMNAAVSRIRERFAVSADLELKSDDLPPVLGDPEMVQLLLECLVTCAIESTDDGSVPEISIRVDQGTTEHVFHVEDNGGPFDDILVERSLNDACVRFATRQEPGGRPGLAVARLTVSKMSGRISGRAKPGSGGVMTFVLPAY